MTRENLVKLGWTRVLCPLAKAADPLSWVLFAVFVALVLLSVGLHVYSGPESFYAKYYAFFWYLAWALLCLATVGPILNLTRDGNQVPLGVLLGMAIGLVIVFILICIYVLVRLNAINSLTALMAASAAAMMAGVGWVVQHQSSARASRRSHTFSVLMQSRLSGEFQDHVRLRGRIYGSGNAVSVEDAPLARKAGLDERIAALSAERDRALSQAKTEHHEEINASSRARIREARRKHRSLTGVTYLLNFYEFICAGIIKREIDEGLIHETLSDIAISLYGDTANLRSYLRGFQPKVFKALDAVVGEKWVKGNRYSDG